MLRNFIVNDKEELCFVVKSGDVNDIVIPMSFISGVDYNRIVEMEESGGELMRVMRDTRLDNGKNALIQYQDLFVTVPKIRKTQSTKEEVEDSEKEPEKSKPVSKRGRPKGSVNKKK